MSIEETSAEPAGTVPQLLSALRESHGVDFVRVRRLLCRLRTGDAQDLTALIEAAGAPRRWTTDVLHSLGPMVENAGDRHRLRDPYARLLGEALDCEGLPEAFVHGAETAALARPALLDEIGRVQERLPASVWSLDHVPATARTIAQRAILLTHELDLADRHLVCLGDHDLTSIAVTLLEPRVRATVVDVDEQLLQCIGSAAAERRLPVRCAFADLRVELPRSVVESADVVFTDPPYTPTGTELFLARGLAALRRDRETRLLFCYGHGDRQLKQGIEVQAALNRLGLVVQAVLPSFNRYDGADAIGRVSALWICQPTRHSWSALPHLRPRDARIYTRGRSAEESAPGRDKAPYPIELEARVARLTGHDLSLEGAPVVRPHASKPALDLEAVVRQAPPGDRDGAARPGQTMVLDLGDQYGAYGLRLLLRSPAAETIVALLSRQALRQSGLQSEDDPVRRLLATTYSLWVDTSAGPALLVARRSPEPSPASWAAVARHLLEHPRAQVVHAWREGLIGLAGRCGGRLTKNEARELIRDTGLVPSLGDGYLGELPVAELRRLVAALERTAALVRAEPGAPEEAR
jgi:hypothetical protein